MREWLGVEEGYQGQSKPKFNPDVITSLVLPPQTNRTLFTALSTFS